MQKLKARGLVYLSSLSMMRGRRSSPVSLRLTTPPAVESVIATEHRTLRAHSIRVRLQMLVAPLRVSGVGLWDGGIMPQNFWLPSRLDG
jgi:hypothetical protein